MKKRDEISKILDSICGRLRVYTAAGAYMGAYEIDRDRYFDLDCSGFPAGVYICSFLPNGARRPLSAKLVVVR